MADSRTSPSWTTTTKLVVALAALVVFGAVVVRFRGIIPLLMVALIASYLLLPIVRLVHTRARLGWTLSANLVFLMVVLLLLLGATAAGLALTREVQGLFFTLRTFLAELPRDAVNLSDRVISLGPWRLRIAPFDLGSLADQAMAAVEPALTRASALATSFAAGAIETFAKTLFVLAIAYFLTLDHDRFDAAWGTFGVPRYEDDIRRLRLALDRIWNSFLRGQLLVVASTALIVSVILSALGVRFSLVLGILFGVAKFVPIVGPILAASMAALVTLFQTGHWYGLSPVGHTLVVILLLTVTDQLIDYLLLPRIMGSSLNLHPVVILVAAIIGASLLGVVGLLLSAPGMATVILLGRYAYCKMFDLSPWDPPIDALSAPPVPVLPRLWLRRRARGRAKGKSDA
jgi:predicted PurR-regulated permease PerM